MRQHIILCGLGKIGWRVLEYLRAAGETVVVIDLNGDPEEPRLEGIALIRGDCRHAKNLERAGLAQARGVLVLTSDDLVSLSTALMVRHLHPTIRIVVRMFNQSLITRLGSAAQNMHALSTSALAAPLLALIARTGEALGVTRLPSGASRQVSEISLAAASPLIGRRLVDLARTHGALVVAHAPAGQSMQFIQEVNPAAILQAGDRLVMFGMPEDLSSLLESAESESLPEHLWGGLLRRLSRVIYLGLALVDMPVKICTTIFLGVIFASILTFHYGMANDTWVDAFYRTISLLATGADMRGDEAGPGTWQKAFISGLRLVGTALTAAFTAILTHYLIRANLGSALEARRIPESGHIIVCGLGNVGLRVVEELLAQGELVVVIEANANNPLIPTARRLGAAVLLGNAVIVEVLRQARATSARAVVAATSNELLNLEIALLVRELMPRQRVVLRLTDPHLAMTLRQAANIRLALSIPELSAPAFIASLYDNQIRSLFQIADQVLALFDLTIHDADAPLLQIPLRSLVTSHGFLPVHRTGADGTDKPMDDTVPMVAGDCYTGIIVLENIQRLYRVNVPPALGPRALVKDSPANVS